MRRIIKEYLRHVLALDSQLFVVLCRRYARSHTDGIDLIRISDKHCDNIRI
jgi:hypothetical protein